MHKLIFLRQASCCSMYGVGLGHGSISSPGSGLGWVDENRPTDNSVLTRDKKRFRTAQHDEDRCPVLSVRRPTVQLHASGPLSNTVRLTAHLTYESWPGLYSEHTSTVVIKCRTDRAPPRRMYHVLLAATLQAPGPAARCIVFPVVLVSVL